MKLFYKVFHKMGNIIYYLKKIYCRFKRAKNLSCVINPRILLFKSVLLIILISLNLTPKLYAKGGNVRFERISIQAGLSQSTVSCILQDHKGFMWFGTEDGLNKYDGYDFTIYKNDLLDSTSLSDSYILSIYEDRSGVLWIGTYGGGLNRFDREKEQFTHYKYDSSIQDSLSDNYVSSIYEDRTGALWIGTNDGLNKFDREKEKFTHYRHEPNNSYSLSHNYVSSIYEDRAGALWIGTEKGLNKFDRERGKFTRYIHDPNNTSSLSNNRVSTIYEDRTGVLWIGTYDGLNKFDREKEQFTRYIHDPKNPHNLSNNRIRAIYEDKSGVLWIGTYGGGLNRFDREKGKFGHWVHKPGNPNSLSNNHILSIYGDKSGVVWIGTYGGGVNRFDRQKGKFGHWVHKPGNSNSLSDNVVLSIYEDRAGVLWIGTNGGGLDRFDREKGQFEHWVNEPGNSNSLCNNRIRAIYEDNSGVVWIGTNGGGLDRFDREREKFTNYRYDPNNPYSLSHNYVRAIYEDRAGLLWIGTFGGLNKFDREIGKYTRYVHNPDNLNSLSNNRVVSIYEDKAGALWIGTGNGLNRFDREEEKFTHYRHNPNDLDSLSNNRVLSIYEDKSGVLWIGTYGGGLNRFDREKGEFTHYRKKDGLPNDVIYGILEDDNNNLWISTNKGLSRFTPHTKAFRNYDVNDGLQSNEFNAGAYHKSESGEMFFGGINGLNAFYPESIKDNSYIPPIVITDFQIFNESVPIKKEKDGRSILKKSITETEAIELSYKDRIVSFEFAALNYVSPGKNEYAYMMAGFEEDWNHVGNRRFVTYTNLPPGKYVFKAKGSNNDGVWNEEGTSLKIIVAPPFWQTWWFRVFSIIAILFLILTVHQIRTHNIRKRNKQLEEINTELNKQISEREKAERALQGAHDNLEKRVEERTNELKATNKKLKQEITERKRAEEAIIKRKNQLELVHRIQNDIPMNLDIETILKTAAESIGNSFGYHKISLNLFDENKNEIVYLVGWNKSGTPTPRGHGQRLGEGLIGKAAELKKTIVANDVSKEPSYVVYYQTKTKSELSIPLLVDHHLVGVLDIQDIEKNVFTEEDVSVLQSIANYLAYVIDEKQTEEALRRSEEKYRTLTENVNVGVYRNTTGSKGKFIEVNPAIVEMFGYENKEEFQATDIIDLYQNPEDRKKFYDKMSKQGFLKNEELELKKKDGTSFITSVSEVAVKDEKGKVLYYDGIIEDITERKLIEEKLKKTLIDLERSNKELEQFAYVASHDLQEPLRMVSSYTQLLARRYKDKLDENANEFIAYAVNGATRMQSLINALLEYSRVGTRGKLFEMTNCESILKEVLVNLMVAVEESGATITYDPLPTVLADSQQLVQLFQNIIENSIKFRSEVTPRIHISAKLNENEWILSVRDNGIGIDPQYKERIFVIFQQLHVKEKYPGTGIGLAICKKIVERHSGRIWMESNSKRGSTFYFTLPTQG